MNVSTINKTLLFVLFVTTPWVASMAGISIKCSPAGAGTVVKQSNGAYKAIPNDGYTFSNWYVDFELDDATETDNPCDFDDYMIISAMYGSGNIYVTANFKKQSITTYAITVKSANSYMGSVTGGGTYAYGSTQTIQAIPNECHQFKQWSDGNTDNPRTITVTSNATYTAEFVEEGCDCGWMTLPELQTAVGYKIGSKGQIILNSAKKSYVFKKMRITYSSTSTLENSFITIKYPDSGTSAFEFTFYKDYQYRINGTGSFYKYLNNKGTHISGNTYEYDLNMICKTSGKYFYVEMWQENFIPSQVQICVEKICTITTSATNGTVTGGGEYNINSKATLTATPNECYRFSKWSDGNTDNPRIVTVNGDATYTAEFIEEGCIDPTWQILYTSTNGTVVTPYVSNFGANIVSNEYKDGQGIITLDGPATRIGNHTFKNCSSLKSITIPNSVTTLDMYAFESCTSLTYITIPEGVISIGEWTFYNCTALKSIDLPDNLASIGDDAFYYCSALTSITLPESLTSIGKYAFSDCSSLTSITIPNGITSIADYIFADCSSLSSITLHEGVTSIGEGAFAGCTSLTSFTIPEGITKIARATFNGCSALTSITIPEGITSIDGYAFWGCSGLTYIISKPTTPPTCGNNAFWNMDNTIPVYVPCGCVNAYKAAMNWKFFKNFQSSDQFTITVQSDNNSQGTVSVEKN